MSTGMEWLGMAGGSLTMHCHQLRRQERDKVFSIDGILEDPLHVFSVLTEVFEHGSKG